MPRSRVPSTCNPVLAPLVLRLRVPQARVQNVRNQEQAVNSQVPQAGVQTIGIQEPAVNSQVPQSQAEDQIVENQERAVDSQAFEAYEEVLQSIGRSNFPPLDVGMPAPLPVAGPTGSTLLTSCPLPAVLAPTACPGSHPPIGNSLRVSLCNCFSPRAYDAQALIIEAVCPPMPPTDETEMQWSVELSFFAGRRKEKGGKTVQFEANAWLMELSRAIAVNQWQTWHCFKAIEVRFTEYARTWYCQLNADIVPVSPLDLHERPQSWSSFLTEFGMHFVTPSLETRRRYSELQQLPNESLLDYATALYGEALELGFWVHDSSSFLSEFLCRMTDKSRAQVFKHIFGSAYMRGLDTNVAAIRGSRLLTDLYELLPQQDEQHRIQSSDEPEVMSRLKPKYRCMMDCIEAICREFEGEVSSGCLQLVEEEPPFSVDDFYLMRN